MADYIKPVVFKIGDEAYGVDINLVQAIENNVSVVPVPNSMQYVKGIINLRGEVVPVYSLKKKFNLPDDEPTDTTIIVSAGNVKIAMEVDQVLEISDITPDNIVEMPFIIKNAATMYMDRVANIDGKLVVLLDVLKLLSEEEEESMKKLTEDMQ